MRQGRWFDRLIPARCVLCTASCAGPLDLCSSCRADLPWLGPGCQRCGMPLPGGAAPLCGACIVRRPRFSSCCAALAYAFPVRELMLRFKQGGDLVAGRVLAGLLAEHLGALTPTISPGTVLLPVPLHPQRLGLRGFNQSAIIARELSRATGLRCATSLVRRSRQSRDQKQLGAAERRRNLGSVFATGPLPPRPVIIVDDIMTTGATADALTATLLAAGATDVSVWCVARAL